MRNKILRALGGIALAISLLAIFTPAWVSGHGGGGPRGMHGSQSETVRPERKSGALIP